MKKNEGIDIYLKVTKMRDILKSVQQLSWDITQFEKRFPLMEADSAEFLDLLSAYVKFGSTLNKISEEYNQEIKKDELISKMKAKLNENKNNPD